LVSPRIFAVSARSSRVYIKIYTMSRLPSRRDSSRAPARARSVRDADSETDDITPGGHAPIGFDFAAAAAQDGGPPVLELDTTGPPPEDPAPNPIPPPPEAALAVQQQLGAVTAESVEMNSGGGITIRTYDDRVVIPNAPTPPPQSSNPRAAPQDAQLDAFFQHVQVHCGNRLVDLLAPSAPQVATRAVSQTAPQSSARAVSHNAPQLPSGAASQTAPQSSARAASHTALQLPSGAASHTAPQLPSGAASHTAPQSSARAASHTAPQEPVGEVIVISDDSSDNAD